MKKLPVIRPESLEGVMKEVAKQGMTVLDKRITAKERLALEVFFGTLTSISLKIFGYLPPEEQDNILTNCGTWFDVGMLFGKSPELLVEILNKVTPQLDGAEVPDWLADRLKGVKSNGQ